MEPMTGPLRRINRAKKRLNILNREIRAFIESKPYRCAIDKDPQDGRYIFSPYIRDRFPPTWGLLIGEFAHGLRSALDNIAWEIAIKRNNRTCFPIYVKDSSEFIGRLKHFPDNIRADIKAVQPYSRPSNERRRHPLWILSRIDNIDKHRIILPGANKIYIATGLNHPKWFYIDGFNRLNKGSIQLKHSTSFNLQQNFKPEIKGQIVFDITCPPADPDDPPRIVLRNLFEIHHFVRKDVYPRFAEFLKPIE